MSNDLLVNQRRFRLLIEVFMMSVNFTKTFFIILVNFQRSATSFMFILTLCPHFHRQMPSDFSLTDKMREFLASTLRMRLINPAKELFTAQTDIKRLISELSAPDTNAIALDTFFQSLVNGTTDVDTEHSASFDRKADSEPKDAGQLMITDSNYTDMDVEMRSPVFSPRRRLSSPELKLSMELGSEEDCLPRKRKIYDDGILDDGEQGTKKIKLPSSPRTYYLSMEMFFVA